jgi:glutamyl-tRNA reductase
MRQYSSQLTQKFLHAPTQALKQAISTQDAAELAAIRRVLGLKVD